MPQPQIPIEFGAQPPVQVIHNFNASVMTWFNEYGRMFAWRRNGVSTYIKVVSELLLQRTHAQRVSDFLPSFTKAYPSWRHISEATTLALEQHLSPLGLAPTRARALKALATALTARGGRFPRSRNQLQELPGVGQYVANAILLFRFNEPQPLLDENMARVLERHFGRRKHSDIRQDSYLQNLATSVVEEIDPVSINWAILDLAALVCRKSNPRCYECPVAHSCAYFKEISPAIG